MNTRTNHPGATERKNGNKTAAGAGRAPQQAGHGMLEKLETATQTVTEIVAGGSDGGVNQSRGSESSV